MSDTLKLIEHPGLFQRIGVCLDNTPHVIFNVLGIAVLSLGCAFVGSAQTAKDWYSANGFYSTLVFFITTSWTWIIIGIGVLLWSGIAAYREQLSLRSENKSLKEKIKELNGLKKQLNSSQEDCQSLQSEISLVHEKLVESWLKSIAKEINMDTHSRVSIYYELNDSFSLLARFSHNPKLSKSHKQKFGLHQGVINQTWQHGFHIEKDSPEYEDSPEKYLTYMTQKYSYSDDEVEKMVMKSCRYLGVAISDADKHIGVILFESLNSENFSDGPDGPDGNVTKIREYCKNYQSHLCEFVRDGISYDKSANKSSQSKIQDANADIISRFGGDHDE